MTRELPSLNAVRFFECAARHQSFTKAGAELCVTQGAVSRQIKLLEQQLECQLFARKGPYLALTSHGERFQETVTDALTTIKQGVVSLRRASVSTLTVSVLPSFATYWLMPRLPGLERQQPGLSLRLACSYQNIDFSVNTDIDVGIRLGTGDWPDLYSKQLTRDRMFPVCTPAMAQEIETPENMTESTILVDPLPYDEWAHWFDAAGVKYQADNTRYYDDTGLQIRAAIQGQGICLSREELIQDHLNSGALVRLFDIDFTSTIHYYFVCPEHRLAESKISLFHDWLFDKDRGVSIHHV